VKKGINAVAWFASQSFHGNASNTDANGETKHRDPLTVAGAIREHVERFLRINGPTYGYDRLEELVTELEDSITAKQFEDSLKMVRAR
jgi:hypothetical protein